MGFSPEHHGTELTQAHPHHGKKKRGGRRGRGINEQNRKKNTHESASSMAPSYNHRPASPMHHETVRALPRLPRETSGELVAAVPSQETRRIEPERWVADEHEKGARGRRGSLPRKIWGMRLGAGRKREPGRSGRRRRRRRRGTLHHPRLLHLRRCPCRLWRRGLGQACEKAKLDPGLKFSTPGKNWTPAGCAAGLWL